MTPSVVILAGLYDFTSDLVCLRLKERGTSFLRINREQLPNFEVSLDPLGAVMRISDGTEAWSITPEVRSFLYRQPVFLRDFLDRETNLTAQLERSQWLPFIRSLTIFREAAWMNHPRETYQAELKPYQLMVAKAVGFAIPNTVVGNALSSFNMLAAPFVVKPLDTVLLRDGADSLFAYTTTSDSADMTTELRRAPVIAQELLSPKIDVRVTVVGQRLFAVRILCSGKGIEGDWRKTPKSELEYQDCTLPWEIESACIRLLSALGLAYGGIDLIENESGYFFIEVNPTGEWAWLNSSVRPIDWVIAEWLAQSGLSNVE